ncbi:MAG: OmpA family protein [Chitinophagaceae bacterium]|nr:OmpA family protein [Chitinophagaceae bacterium]
MIQRITLAWALGLLVVLSSCVSSKKYKAATSELQAAKNTNDSLLKVNSGLQSQLNDAIASNKLLTSERDKYQQEADKANSALKEYQTAVSDYMAQADEVEKKLKDRMADYADRGANVEYKNGMVYLTLDDALLFKSGSSKISKDGETVLGTFAGVVNEYPKWKVWVVGHTDDRAGRGTDNWTLSTNRANAVVKELKDNKLDPARFTAAGQGEYNPVADNSTAEGRAQNRRTEIILVPETFKLLNRQ